MNTQTSTLEEIFNNSTDLKFGFTTALSLTQASWALGGALGSQIAGISGSKIGRKTRCLWIIFFSSRDVYCSFSRSKSVSGHIYGLSLDDSSMELVVASKQQSAQHTLWKLLLIISKVLLDVLFRFCEYFL